MSDRSAWQAFLFIVILHMVVWIGVPVLTHPNAPLDAIEMIYWGHEWQPGYYKHPPLPAWLARIAVLTGGSSGWPVYTLAQFCTVGCFAAVFLLTRDLLGNRPAVLALLVMQGCYYFNFTTVEFNNNVCSRVWWAVAVLCLYRALMRTVTPVSPGVSVASSAGLVTDAAPDTDRSPGSEFREVVTVRGQAGGLRQPLAGLLYWAGTGVAIGLGMLSKYDTAILVVTMAAFAVLHPVGRAALKTPGPYLCLTAAVLLFSPHLIWLLQNDFPTIHYFLRRSRSEKHWYSHVLSPLKFAASQLGAVLPVLLLLTPVTGWRWRSRPMASSVERFQRTFLLTFVAGPVLLILVFAAASGSTIRSMWGTAIWTFSAVLVLFLFEIRLKPSLQRRLAVSSAIAALLMAGACIGRNVLLPYVSQKGSRIHFPGQQLAEEIQRQSRPLLGGSPQIIAGPTWIAGNVAVYSDQPATVFADTDPAISPWVSDADLAADGGVIVWAESDSSEYRELLRERFPQAQLLSPIALRWQTGADLPELRFFAAVVPPAGSLRRLHPAPRFPEADVSREDRRISAAAMTAR